MAHLWTLDLENRWVIFPLGEDTVSLAEFPPRRKKSPLSGTSHRSRVLLVPCETEADGWALVAGSERRVRANGLKLGEGIRVLRDRDEIRVDSVGTFFYSEETIAEVEPFPGAERPIYCPRCKKEIEKGARAVRCPSATCHVWHHQDEDAQWTCWTYNDTCALCPQPTDQREFAWSPEDL